MSDTRPRLLETSAGDFPLHEYRFRRWSILHAGAVLTEADETHALVLKTQRLPYGVSLWPSAIALAHELATRGEAARGRSVLELGAGTGLPGIAAASLGAGVVQTDRDELSLQLCRRNGERNGASIQYRLADWTSWDVAERFDWILGSDILYGETYHPQLRRIFEANLATGGRVLLSDPYREMSFRLLEALEADGWRVTCSRWDVGAAAPIGVFELVPPDRGR